MLEDQYNKHPNLAKKWINLGMIVSHQTFSYAKYCNVYIMIESKIREGRLNLNRLIF